MVTLRDNIKTLLDDLDVFEEVSDEPKMNFSGYPACFISPSGNENDYQSTQDNERVYGFKIWIFQEYEHTSLQDAYEKVMNMVDEVINQMDAQESPDISDADRKIDNGVNTGAYTLIGVMAVPSRFASDESDRLIAAEVTIKCRVLVDLTQL